VLNVTVLEAKDLKPLNLMGRSDPFVVLSMDDKKEKSTFKTNTSDPVWNEEFSIGVTTLRSTLKVEVFDKSKNDTPEGAIEIPLKNLEKQEKMDNWYDLSNSANEDCGQIRLKFHLIWSRYQYFSDNFNRTENKINTIKKDMVDLEKYLVLFEKPFGILLFVEIDEHMNKKLWGNDEEYLQQTRKSFSPRMTVNKNAGGLHNALENVFKFTLKTTNVEWNYLTKVCMYCVVIFSAMALFGRSDFLNLVVGVAIWLIFIRDAKYDVIEYLERFMQVLVITTLYDFFWLYFHNKGFWNSEYNSGVRKFALVFSYFNFIAKIILLGCVYVQVKKAKNQRPSDGRKTVSKG